MEAALASWFDFPSTKFSKVKDLLRKLGVVFLVSVGLEWPLTPPLLATALVMGFFEPISRFVSTVPFENSRTDSSILAK